MIFLLNNIFFRTKFFFRDVEEAIGPLQSKFIEPLSHSSWLACAAIAAMMTFTLIAVSLYQNRQHPCLEEESNISYALLNVVAAFCQQGKHYKLLPQLCL